jgi:hypothetical protein
VIQYWRTQIETGSARHAGRHVAQFIEDEHIQLGKMLSDPQEKTLFLGFQEQRDQFSYAEEADPLTLSAGSDPETRRLDRIARLAMPPRFVAGKMPAHNAATERKKVSDSGSSARTGGAEALKITLSVMAPTVETQKPEPRARKWRKTTPRSMRGLRRIVRMMGIWSLARFQAQSIWEISVEPSVISRASG